MPRDFTLHQFRIFLKAAEVGSITRAANALSIPQPSVSRSISRMESTLQVKLIERTRNGIRLTTAGERFQNHAREALRQFDLAGIAASQGSSELGGEVRLAAPESVGGIIFLPLVKRFQQLHPGARIRVMASASAHTPTLMDNNVIDMGIIADTHPAPAGRAEFLCAEAFYLIGPKSAEVSTAETVKMKDIAELPLFLNAMQGGFRARIDDAFQRKQISLNVIAEIDANEPLLDLVLDEAGYTILPFSTIARQSRMHQFSAARIVAAEITRSLKLVMTSQRPLAAIGRETAHLVRQIVQEQAEIARWKLAGTGRET